jgi:signal transduction histidine kinase
MTWCERGFKMAETDVRQRDAKPSLTRERGGGSARHLESRPKSKKPQTARKAVAYLVSEVVTNSVRHAPSAPGATVGLSIGVERKILRVDVSDRSPG